MTIPSTPGLIAIMGSGELTKSMATAHQFLISEIAHLGTVRPVFLDTPAAFQENVDQIGERAVAYFQRTFGLGLAVAHWRDYLDPASRSEFLACLEEANYIFAGPGSPSFALRCWRGTEVPSILRRCLRSGGCLVFASAAALTLGAFTIPVYEIFKVGEELHWLPGMNLLSEVGFRVVVVPHFDSGSGNDFDTRFCYLGERRFLRMMELLPPDVAVLGVDEHTACILNRAQMTLAVRGRGAVTFRNGALQRRLTAGQGVPIHELSPGSDEEERFAERSPLPEPTPQGGDVHGLQVPDPDAENDIEVLVQLAVRLVRHRERTEADGEATDDELLLQRTVLRLRDLARAHEKTYESQVRPLVESLMEIRDRARLTSDWVLADQIRDSLKRVGIEVHDTHSGSKWSPV